MSEESAPPILKAFPHRHYHPEARLMTWHPRGVLDDVLADRIIEFIETEERMLDTPFDRFTDLNGLTEIRLKVGHAFNVAERRRAGYQGEPVKSAVFSDWVIGLGIARLYEALMKDAHIKVRAFRSRDSAAEWLGVPADLLQPPSEDP